MVRSCERKHEMAGRLGAGSRLMILVRDTVQNPHCLYMQPQYVKIDISIVRNIDDDEDKQSLVANFMSYTKARGIKSHR